jgi:hypothetical protein
VLDLVEEPQQGLNVEDRLRDGELGPRLHVLPEPIQLAFWIQRRRVQPHADDGLRLRVDGLAAQVDAAI